MIFPRDNERTMQRVIIFQLEMMLMMGHDQFYDDDYVYYIFY